MFTPQGVHRSVQAALLFIVALRTARSFSGEKPTARTEPVLCHIRDAPLKVSSKAPLRFWEASIRRGHRRRRRLRRRSTHADLDRITRSTIGHGLHDETIRLF